MAEISEDTQEEAFGENETLPSFAEFAKKKMSESPWMSKLAPGKYTVQFMGGETFMNKWGSTSVKYTFIQDGVEKTLESGSSSLLGLTGREGQTVTVVKGINPKTGH